MELTRPCHDVLCVTNTPLEVLDLFSHIRENSDRISSSNASGSPNISCSDQCFCLCTLHSQGFSSSAFSSEPSQEILEGQRYCRGVGRKGIGIAGYFCEDASALWGNDVSLLTSKSRPCRTLSVSVENVIVCLLGSLWITSPSMNAGRKARLNLNRVRADFKVGR